MPRSCSSARAPAFTKTGRVRPFVGAAGKYLEELLAKSASREDRSISPMWSSAGPREPRPAPDEIEACRPYLDRQIELIRPRSGVTLGRFSMQRYFPGASISRIHGQPKRVGNVIYYPMFHPAAALHQPRWREPGGGGHMSRIPELLAKVDEMQEAEPPSPRPNN
jgi:uracil-DNA glycosylase